jgi:hypothetical protein
VKLDLDGPVFGSFDPPVIPFSAPLDSKGGGKSVTATTPDGAKVAVKGTNSVRITVTKIKKTRTRVTLVVTNADNKTAKKTVTFVGSGSRTALMDHLGS